MTTRLKNHHVDEYGGVFSAQGLSDARHHLTTAKAHKPVDSLDAKLQADQIEMLQEVIRKREEGIAHLTERERESEERAVQQIADAEQARKQAVLEELRRGFPGSDEDFRRLSDQLYDDYLIQNTGAAMARAKASGRYRA